MEKGQKIFPLPHLKNQKKSDQYFFITVCSVLCFLIFRVFNMYSYPQSNFSSPTYSMNGQNYNYYDVMNRKSFNTYQSQTLSNSSIPEKNEKYFPTYSKFESQPNLNNMPPPNNRYMSVPSIYSESKTNTQEVYCIPQKMESYPSRSYEDYSKPNYSSAKASFDKAMDIQERIQSIHEKINHLKRKTETTHISLTNFNGTSSNSQVMQPVPQSTKIYTEQDLPNAYSPPIYEKPTSSAPPLDSYPKDITSLSQNTGLSYQSPD